MTDISALRFRTNVVSAAAAKDGLRDEDDDDDDDDDDDGVIASSTSETPALPPPNPPSASISGDDFAASSSQTPPSGLSSSASSTTTPFRLYESCRVPENVREFNIWSGYRYPNCSIVDCLRSAFSPSNESLNFWTHFLPLLFAVRQCYLVAKQVSIVVDSRINYGELPLLIYCLAVIGLLACSSFAHLFNSLSLKARQVFFFIDYAGISLYGSFCTIAYFFLIRPRYFIAKKVFIWGANFIAILCCASCCLTRKDKFPRSLKSVVRAAVTTVPYVFGSVPAFFALYNVCDQDCQNFSEMRQNATKYLRPLEENHEMTPSYFGLISDWPNFGNDSANQGASSCCGVSTEANVYFVSHARWFLMAVLTFTAKVPERFFPGRFDFIGHSHQLFHVCIAMGAYRQYQMVLTYYRGHRLPSPWTGTTTLDLLNHNLLSSDGNNTVADMSTTILSMAFVLTSLAAIIGAFASCVDPRDGRCHSLRCCWSPFPTSPQHKQEQVPEEDEEEEEEEENRKSL